MGTIKTTNIETITGSGTLTLGQSGETITVPSGATLNLSNATQTGVGGVNTPYFEASRTSNQTITHDTFTKVAVDSEVFDTDNNYDPTTNYRFTPTTAGKYYIYGQATAQSSSTGQLKRYTLSIRKNGSDYKFMSNYFTGNEAYLSNIYVGSVIDFNGSSDYVELWCKLEYASSGTLQINSSPGKTELSFGGYKIIE